MSAPLFDPSSLEMLFELEDSSEPSVVPSIVEQFQEDALAIFDKLERALHSENFLDFADAAHSLKGGSAQLGLLRLAALAHTLETAARNRRKDPLLNGLVDAKSCYHDSRCEMELFLQRRIGKV